MDDAHAGAIKLDDNGLLPLPGERGTAEPILRELLDVAARAHDDRDEAFAWTNLMLMMSQARGKIDEALALVPSARAAVLRAGDPIDLRADLLYAHAIVLDSVPARDAVLAEGSAPGPGGCAWTIRTGCL